MTEVKGTIKVSEHKIIIKTDKGLETWIKKPSTSLDTKEWVEFKGDIYELENFDYEDEFE